MEYVIVMCKSEDVTFCASKYLAVSQILDVLRTGQTYLIFDQFD
jgi:hypothetical protein